MVDDDGEGGLKIAVDGNGIDQVEGVGDLVILESLQVFDAFFHQRLENIAVSGDPEEQALVIHHRHGIQAVFLKNLQGFLQTDVGGDGHNLFPGRQTIADEHDSSSLVAINRLSGRYSILPVRKKILPPSGGKGRGCPKTEREAQNQ